MGSDSSCKDFVLFILVAVSNMCKNSFLLLDKLQAFYSEFLFESIYTHMIYVSSLTKIMSYCTLHYCINIPHNEVLLLWQLINSFCLSKPFHRMFSILLYCIMLYFFGLLWMTNVLDQFLKRKSLPGHFANTYIV